MELAECLTEGYSTTTPKAVHQAMFNDVLLAVQTCDGRPACLKAVESLVKAAERVLPQQKRQQVLSEHKRTRVALAKRLRAQGLGLRTRAEDCGSCEGSGSDGGDVGSQPPPLSLECLPLDPLLLLTRHLDPLSLAALACSSVQMRGVALGSDAWHTWAHLIFPSAAVAAEPTQAAGPGHSAWHRLFCEQAAANAALVVQWHCRRVLVKGVPQWREPACCPAPRAARMASRLLAPHKVALWLVQRAGDEQRTESSGASSSGEDAWGGGVQQQLRFWSLGLSSLVRE
ncbi:hypothetical protein FOA52_008953 [Chlamydomonas sp. UWO 241]|nr:hypothetical protein FOA52_008953 [Chlamydomonas sp. UWO 241]